MASFGIERGDRRVYRWAKGSEGGHEALSLTGPSQDYRPLAHAVALEFAEAEIPEEWLGGAPSQVERFIGRVEELEAEGGVLARVQEVPGGIEFMISLEAGDLEGGPAHVGALIKLFTWIETQVGLGKPDEGLELEKPCLKAQVIPKVLSDEERAKLRQFLIDEGVLEEDRA